MKKLSQTGHDTRGRGRYRNRPLWASQQANTNLFGPRFRPRCTRHFVSDAKFD